MPFPLIHLILNLIIRLTLTPCLFAFFLPSSSSWLSEKSLINKKLALLYFLVISPMKKGHLLDRLCVGDFFFLILCPLGVLIPWLFCFWHILMDLEIKLLVDYCHTFKDRHPQTSQLWK